MVQRVTRRREGKGEREREVSVLLLPRDDKKEFALSDRRPASSQTGKIPSAIPLLEIILHPSNGKEGNLYLRKREEGEPFDSGRKRRRVAEISNFRAELCSRSL